MESTAFWQEQEEAQKVVRQVARIKSKIAEFDELEELYQDVAAMVELGENEGDSSFVKEAEQSLGRLERELKSIQLKTLLSDEYAPSNAILSLHAGAGGTEAQDWVEMLFRLYTRWVARREFSWQLMDSLPGDEAGLKSVTFEVQGDYAYGFLRPEKGVHRLVRISPFDSSSRRHTSFASVEVLPVIEDDEEITISSDELRVDTFRASGAGGQHVNKTDSAVRLTHLSTGIVVACQSERSQHANRLSALRILRGKLAERREAERQQELTELRGEHQDIAWGSQIRSYVFQPYSLVKDHRTNLEIGNVQAVMDGDIDQFIYAYLYQQAENK